MRVSATGESGNHSCEGFLKFDLSSITEPITEAKLTLYMDYIQGTPSTQALYEVSDDTWTESTLERNNKPSASGIAIATWSPVAYTDIEIDIISKVQNALNGDKILSLMIDGVGGTGYVYYNSKDVGFDKTKLMYTIAAPPVTVNPTDDAYVRGGTYGDDCYGSDGKMTVKNAATDLYDRKAYVKFDFNSFEGTTTQDSKLRVYCEMVSSGVTERTINIYGVSDESWIESGITWNNAPLGTTFLGNIVVDSQGWYELDVTSYVDNNMSDKIVSFLLINEGEEGDNNTNFTTKEGSEKPELIVSSTKPTTPPSTQTNYIVNGSFEIEDNGFATDWITSMAGGSYPVINFVLDYDDYIEGSKAALIDSTGYTRGDIQQVVALTPGNSYSFSGCMKTIDKTTRDTEIQIAYGYDDGSSITYDADIIVGSASGNSNWLRHSYDFTLPIDRNCVRVKVSSLLGNGDTLIDDFLITKQ